MGADTQLVLVRASALLFLFQALATIDEDEQGAAIEAQALRVMGDLMPCDGGTIVMGRSESELSAKALARGVSDLCARVKSEGVVVIDGRIAAPLYVRGGMRGMVVLNVQDPDGQLDTLTAIVTIAVAAVESARELERLLVEKTLLEERSGTGIVGESAALRRVLRMTERVAPQDATVLILGESGTGKELIARRVHEQSRRATAPFVAINCAALTESLLESEMFGHEKGAFTGAVGQKKGRLEMAEGGTVFLDEIGELAPSLQAKMLRVLQQREFERVGGTRTLSLDVRLIAATNRDLAACVRAGTFREDLYHRLNVVAISTPPLRDRADDIPALARHFLARASARCGRRVTGFSVEAERCLAAYSWPGNVRELENAIERAVVLGEDEVVRAEDLPETVLESAAPTRFQSTVLDAKRESIVRAWRKAGGDYKAAAQELGIHPNSLLRMVRNLGLRAMLEGGTKG